LASQSLAIGECLRAADFCVGTGSERPASLSRSRHFDQPAVTPMAGGASLVSDIDVLIARLISTLKALREKNVRR